MTDESSDKTTNGGGQKDTAPAQENQKNKTYIQESWTGKASIPGRTGMTLETLGDKSDNPFPEPKQQVETSTGETKSSEASNPGEKGE